MESNSASDENLYYNYLVLHTYICTCAYFHIIGIGIFSENITYTCSKKMCDKNGQFWGFVPHIYFCLFELFMNICTFCINTLLY